MGFCATVHHPKSIVLVPVLYPRDPRMKHTFFIGFTESVIRYRSVEAVQLGNGSLLSDKEVLYSSYEIHSFLSNWNKHTICIRQIPIS